MECIPWAADGEALDAAYLDREMPCCLNALSQRKQDFTSNLHCFEVREAGQLSLARQSRGERARAGGGGGEWSDLTMNGDS